MENLNHEIYTIHQEKILREANISRALHLSGLRQPPSIDHARAALGDWLIRLGTKIKEPLYTKLTTEEATSPTYLIIL